MNLSKFSRLGLVFCISLILLGCGKDDTESNLPTLEEYIASNNLTTQQTSSGVHYIISNPGTGRTPGQESTVKFSFKGTLTNGTIFSDSNGQETYFNITTFITGLKEGLQLLKEGGSGTFIIPYELAYGTAGINNIPGRADLIYEVEMSSVLIPNDFYIQQNAFNITQTTPSGVKVLIEQAGDGNFPNATSTVVIKYRGYFTDDFTFDTSADDFVSLSLQQVIIGWQEAIPLFDKGAKGKIFVPYQVGYGVEGFSSIPGRTDLIFDIELQDFN